MRVNDFFGVIRRKLVFFFVTNSFFFILIYKGIIELDYFLEMYLYNKYNRISVEKINK